MENFIPFTQEDLNAVTSFRKGEIKFGERLEVVAAGMGITEAIEKSEAPFVLFGIPEDIGVRANFGRPGTSQAFENTIKSLVNIQHNRYCKGYDLLLLGQIDTSSYMIEAKDLNPNDKDNLKKLQHIVGAIDKDVAHLVSKIIKAHKIPIVIGGGHNNAYGLLKGTALALAKPINCINFDAHTDFRALEGRHSGNGFSYAFEEGFLAKYFIFGLHENYTSKSVFSRIKEHVARVQYNTYEQISIRKELSFEKELAQAHQFIGATPYGIEMDLDAVANLASSAMSFSGFSAEKARRFLHYFASSKNAIYLHLCEGAPSLADEHNPNLVGKFISYLITDFIKAKQASDQ